MAKRKPSPHAVNRLRGAFPCLAVLVADGEKVRLLVASGFLFEEDGILHWITAGHVLNTIREFNERGLVRQMRWMDGGPGSIPASPSLLEQFSVDKDGLDLAIAPINSIEAENLRRGPDFLAFKLRDCLSRAEINKLLVRTESGASEVLILGFPQEWASYSESDAGRHQVEYRIGVRRIQIPILKPTNRRKLDAQGIPTKDEFWSPYCFYGIISNTNETGDVPLKEIEGVSGGPVIAVFNGREYVVGIQSAWLPRALTVRVVAMDGVKYVFTKYRKLKRKQLAATKQTSRQAVTKKRKARGGKLGKSRVSRKAE